MIIDKFGHCIKCGKGMIVEKVINNQIKKVPAPDYGQIQFQLDDGSKMRVVMCLSCQRVYDEKENSKTMKSVIAGWQREVDSIPHWDEKKRKNFMNVYKKKKIKHKIKEFKYGTH